MNQETNTTTTRPRRGLRVGLGQHFTNTRQKPVKPLPHIEPPKPPTDSHTFQATPDGKKELADD